MQYHTKPDSGFQVTSISLYATDSGADSGKDGGKAEVEPGNAGGCSSACDVHHHYCNRYVAGT